MKEKAWNVNQLSADPAEEFWVYMVRSTRNPEKPKKEDEKSKEKNRTAYSLFAQAEVTWWRWRGRKPFSHATAFY